MPVIMLGYSSRFLYSKLDNTFFYIQQFIISSYGIPLEREINKSLVGSIFISLAQCVSFSFVFCLLSFKGSTQRGLAYFSTE